MRGGGTLCAWGKLRCDEPRAPGQRYCHDHKVEYMREWRKNRKVKVPLSLPGSVQIKVDQWASEVLGSGRIPRPQEVAEFISYCLIDWAESELSKRSKGAIA